MLKQEPLYKERNKTTNIFDTVLKQEIDETIDYYVDLAENFFIREVQDIKLDKMMEYVMCSLERAFNEEIANSHLDFIEEYVILKYQLITGKEY